MSKRALPVAALMLAATLVNPSAHAETQQAHVHGLATLHVAVEGKTLHIELESPAANMVGFEHLPATGEDRKRVHDAADLLRDGGKLFVPAATAWCALQSAEVESALMDENHHGEHEGEERHDDHEGEGEDDHDEHEGETHSEFHASYRFHCEKPSALTHLDVTLFNSFPATEALNAQFATDSGQGAATLRPGATRLTF